MKPLPCQNQNLRKKKVKHPPALLNIQDKVKIQENFRN